LERRFPGASEAILHDPERAFRRLATRDGSEAWLLGSPLGAQSDVLESGTDAFGRFVLLRHDPFRRTLAVRTDRYGSIPFFRAQAQGRVHLARRLRTLADAGAAPRRADPAALAALLAFGRTLGPRTLLQGVEAVESGVTTFDLDSGAVRHERGFCPEALLADARVGLDEAAPELVARFLEGVAACSADGEEVVVTLSGGLDTRCLLAALLQRGRRPSAHCVSWPGSRAGRYARRIAELCHVPFHGHVLDPSFAGRYFELLHRVVEATEGMRMAPQPEMLWLRDQIPETAVVLHGAFGELAKLRVLRDYRVDDRVLVAGRAALPDLLWQRYEPGFRSRLALLAPELRERVAPLARAELESRLGATPPELGPAEALQMLYLGEFLRSTRFGHELWNERVRTRFPFLYPPFLDALLRVRSRDRLEPLFQRRFLERVHGPLFRMPDENTGTRMDAGRGLKLLVRVADRAADLLRGGGVESGHGDLLAWLGGMRPSLEEVVEGCPDDGVFDRGALRERVARLRRTQARSGPRRGLAARAGRADTLALQAFLVLHLSRDVLRWE
jgi:asparagine synthase (glutamine-hydrolysing)